MKNKNRLFFNLLLLFFRWEKQNFTKVKLEIPLRQTESLHRSLGLTENTAGTKGSDFEWIFIDWKKKGPFSQANATVTTVQHNTQLNTMLKTQK